MARGGMHHQARWLVDHDEVLVLKQDIERDVFCLRLSRCRRRQGDSDKLPCFRLLAYVDDNSPLDSHKSLSNKALETGAADFGVGLGQHLVQAICAIGKKRKCFGNHMNEAANENQKYEPTPQQKKLLRLVYIMGIVFVLLFLGLIGGLIWRASTSKSVPVAVPLEAELMNNVGGAGFDPADIRQLDLDGDRLAITTSHALIVVDLKSRKILLRVQKSPN
jgi:hypothetical protein